jgi:hypothetical protein
MATILLTLLLLNDFQVDSQLLDSRVIDNQLKNEWTNSAIATIYRHLYDHRGCELKRIIPTLQNMQFHANDKLDAGFRMSAYPRRGDQWPMTHYNSNLEWSEYKWVRASIHEALHHTWIGPGWMCGDDNPSKRIRGVAICALFRENQYSSGQINDVLDRHLADVLDDLDKTPVRIPVDLLTNRK